MVSVTAVAVRAGSVLERTRGIKAGPTTQRAWEIVTRWYNDGVGDIDRVRVAIAWLCRLAERRSRVPA